MRNYTNIKVQISEWQKQKLKNAFQPKINTITIRLKFQDLNCEDVIPIIKSQCTEMAKAYEANKGMTIKMSKTQLAHNIMIEGEFLPALAWLIQFLIGTVVPALGAVTLSGLASTGVQMLIWNELYLKKGGCVCQIETDEKGCDLDLVSGDGFETLGNTLY